MKKNRVKKQKVKRQRKTPPVLHKNNAAWCKSSLEKTDDLRASAIKAIQALPKDGVVVVYQRGLDQHILSEIKKRPNSESCTLELDSFYERAQLLATFLRTKLFFSHVKYVLFILHNGGDVSGDFICDTQVLIETTATNSRDVCFDVVCNKSVNIRRIRMKDNYTSKKFVFSSNKTAARGERSSIAGLTRANNLKEIH